MSPRRRLLTPRVSDLFVRGRAVATHAELQAAGVPKSTITSRIGPDGPWQRLLPGVVLGHRGVPTRHERRAGALSYAGDDGLLTGLSALDAYGVRTARRLGDQRVHVLVPHRRQVTSHHFVRVTRTRREIKSQVVRGLRCCPLVQALVDACRWLETMDDVRALVADAVQNHRVTAEDIRKELMANARQRTALTRRVLREIWAGIRSVAEAKLREEFRRHGVPQPLWNRSLRSPDGQFIASPDALWPDVGLVVEIDSVAWHLSPAAYRATQRRQRHLSLWGLEVISVSPQEIMDDPAAVCRDILAKLGSMEPRPLLVLVGEPIAA